MKSAYELAMGRLEKVVPAVTLTEDQKTAINDINIRMDAAIAEKRILLEGELAKAAPHEQESIRQQLASELRRIEEKREVEKEKFARDRHPKRAEHIVAGIRLPCQSHGGE